MNRVEASLYRAFEKNGAGAPARRKAVLRTQQACARLVRERRMLVRTGSAAMFRQVARFSAPRLWAAQALVLLAGVAGLYSLGDVLQGLAGGYLGGYVAFFSPVLVLGCLPEMFRSEACGMAELESLPQWQTLHAWLSYWGRHGPPLGGKRACRYGAWHYMRWCPSSPVPPLC